MMKLALLIIDIQKKNFNINQTCSDSLNSAIEYINAIIPLFRKRNLPIFVIQHKDEAENLVPGTPDFEVSEKLHLEPSDSRIIKTYGNAFNGTGLTERLKALGIDTVIVTGFCAEWCVLSTCRGAEDINLTPIIVRGSLASDKPERIRFVEEIQDVISYGALKALLTANT